jgi:hypothetical protein
MTDNITVRLAKRPTAMVTADCFTIAHEPIRQPDEGEVLVRVPAGVAVWLVPLRESARTGII